MLFLADLQCVLCTCVTEEPCSAASNLWTAQYGNVSGFLSLQYIPQKTSIKSHLIVCKSLKRTLILIK